MWTIKRIQEERPAVQVMVDGKKLTGMIVGTRLEYPMMRVHHGPASRSFEFAWETIIRALEENRTLLT